MGEPETIRVQANGLTFAALQWSPPATADAPLALMVHGYPDSAWTWRHLGPYLAERGWRAVAPFTRGYGPSDLAPDDSYLIADQASDLLALHTALGGDGRSVLIGHDWGAVATWAVTEREPSRFRRYVAMSIPPPIALLLPLRSLGTLGMGLRQARLSWYFIFNQLPFSARSLDSVIPMLWRQWSPGYDATADVTRALAALDSPGRRRAALRYYRNNLQRGIVKTFTIKAGAPVLYLHGADDGCVQPALATAFPDLFVEGTQADVVPGVGHFMQLENPELINEKISSWVSA